MRDSRPARSSEPVTIYTDGGSRGNPGPAAIGGVVLRAGDTLEEFSAYVGEKTNNQAEYMALLSGMERAAEFSDGDLTCYLDSELVVKQVTGAYKIKSAELRKFIPQVKALEERFRSVAYRHTYRERNARADALVNRALDARR